MCELASLQLVGKCSSRLVRRCLVAQVEIHYSFLLEGAWSALSLGAPAKGRSRWAPQPSHNKKTEEMSIQPGEKQKQREEDANRSTTFFLLPEREAPPSCSLFIPFFTCFSCFLFLRFSVPLHDNRSTPALAG